MKRTIHPLDNAWSTRMIHRSPYPEVEIPDVPVTDHVLRRADELVDRTALVDWPSGRTLTFGELRSAIHRTAGGLAARGYGKGDVLAIYSPNTLTYPVAFHGAAVAGGVVTTANPMYTAPEFAKQLEDSGARFLVTVGHFLDNARKAAELAGGIEEIFTFDGAEGTTPFSELMGAGPLEEPAHIEPAEDLVALPYSSGTTGISKGVMLTHRNLVANMVQIKGTESLCRSIEEDDTLVAILPFYHIYGMGVIMNYALSRGARVVVHSHFELEEFLASIQEHGITFAHVVPPILLAMAKDPLVDEYDLSSLDLINSGAAPLGEELARSVEKRVGCTVGQGYGLTETSPVTHHAATEREPPTPKESIGPLLPNTEIQVVDVHTGESLGPGERGELWIRGPQVMKGYLNQAEATADAIDEDGWFHTGDIGYVDERGDYYIVDRLKELIKFKGFQVAPAELEDVLLTHPRIRDAAVVRSPDEEAGEVPKAFIVRSDDSLAAEEVMDFVAEQVSPHKKVRRVEFVDTIPKSRSGKILRRVLIDREMQEREQAS